MSFPIRFSVFIKNQSEALTPNSELKRLVVARPDCSPWPSFGMETGAINRFSMLLRGIFVLWPNQPNRSRLTIRSDSTCTLHLVLSRIKAIPNAINFAAAKSPPRPRQPKAMNRAPNISPCCMIPTPQTIGVAIQPTINRAIHVPNPIAIQPALPAPPSSRHGR